MSFKLNKAVNALYYAVGMLAFAYIVIRAFSVGITYDESWTIKDFASQEWMHILNYTPCDANNHMLNTLLIKLCFLSGNHSLFVARLPNVLAGALYIWSAIRLVRAHLSSFMGVACFLLLLFNPFLLDFFSLARGYGLGLGFMAAALPYLLQYVQDGLAKNALKAMAMTALAVLSNFVMLNFDLAVIIVITICPLLDRSRYQTRRTLIYTAAITAITAGIIYEPIRKLKLSGSLYYGGRKDFFTDTLCSLAQYSCYEHEINPRIMLALQLFLVVAALSIIISFFFNRKLRSSKSMLLLLTALCVLSVILQHALLGTPYVIDRGALFFYPLFILCICFSWNDYAGFFAAKSVAVLGVAAFGLNFFQHANHNKTSLWYFDAHTKEILQWLNEEGKRQNRQLTLDFSWLFERSMQYYTALNDYPFVRIPNVQHREDAHVVTEYYVYLDLGYLLIKDGYDSPKQALAEIYGDTALYYPGEHVILYTHLKQSW